MTYTRDLNMEDGQARDGAFGPLSFFLTRFDPGLFLAGLLSLFVILPMLQPGLPGTADTPIHFYRTLELARSWAPGVVYPRWAPDLAYGYGYPLWNFAPALPYFIPLALRTLGLSLEASLKAFVILTALGYPLGAYLFVRDSLGPRAGLVGAAIYSLAPFALREVLLYGGNYPQYLAIGLYPWVLWALRRVVLREGGKWLYILLTAFLYGAVILSHLFHALVLTPVAVTYAVVLWLAGRHGLGRLVRSVLALGLGLLWTAFFWLPVLYERTFTRAVEARYLSVSPFYLRFLDWGELLAWPRALDTSAANPWVPFSLSVAVLLLAGLGWLALVWPGGKGSGAGVSRSTIAPSPQPPVIRWQAMFFLGVLAFSVFLTLPVSNWVWANAPFLAVAEFPWRWLGLSNLSLAFLGGAGAYWLSPRRRTAFALSAVLAVTLTSAVYLYPFRPFVRYGDTLTDLVSYELVHQTVGTTTLGEYLPRWVTSIPGSSPLAEALARGDPIQRLDPASLPRGATARLLEQTSVSEGYHFDSKRPFQARFLTYYFPGWRAYLDGQAVDISIEPGSGLIIVQVPAGVHDLRLRFGDTPLRTASNAITALSLATLVTVSVWCIARRGRRRPGVTRQPGTESDFYSTALPFRSSLLIASVLVGLLLIKILVVDPHTNWFRRESPPGQVSGVQHALQVSLDERVRLLGYDLDREVVSQGGALRVTLYWGAQRPLVTNYRSFVHLDAPTDQRTWAGSDNFHPGDVTAQIELPTATWDTAHYVRDEHLLRIPIDVPPVSLELRAGLYDPDTGQRLSIAGGSGDTIRLQSVRVTPGRGLPAEDVPNPTDYRLGEHIRLLGYDWKPEDTAPSEGGRLTLYWQADAPLETDYVVFIHVLDEARRLAWGADGAPLGGLYPTSDWRPGSVVADPRRLALADLPPGNYVLVAGMYHPDTLSRLPVIDARGQSVTGDAVPLTGLTWR